MSLERTAIIPLCCIALMNAFQTSLPCFPASYYQSVELISLLAAGDIVRLPLLIYIPPKLFLLCLYFFFQHVFYLFFSGMVSSEME